MLDPNTGRVVMMGLPPHLTPPEGVEKKNWNWNVDVFILLSLVDHLCEFWSYKIGQFFFFTDFFVFVFFIIPS